MDYKFISWNVNGIRAIEKKGFLRWLEKENPDILALQETKAHPEQLGETLRNPSGYDSYWNTAEKKGYSGVCVYTKRKPEKVRYGLGSDKFDREGRVLILEYERFYLLNIYFPNGKMSPERLAFKLEFYQEFLNVIGRLRKQSDKTIVVCGDVNTAHKPLDLARPKQNENNSGFLPEERACLDQFIEAGLVDTFRVFNHEGENYTWWDYKTRARTRNIGWRIDYFYIDKNFSGHLKDASILSDVPGSDHCPIGITLEL